MVVLAKIMLPTELHMQGQWLVYGGFPLDDQTDLFVFDFATLSWSMAEVTGKPLLANRQSYTATCHQGAMLIMGGGSYYAAA